MSELKTLLRRAPTEQIDPSLQKVIARWSDPPRSVEVFKLLHEASEEQLASYARRLIQMHYDTILDAEDVDHEDVMRSLFEGKLPGHDKERNEIRGFTGEYAFLSNFYPVLIVYEGREYPSVEHAYQAAKTDDLSLKALIAAAPTPGKAKRLGKGIERPGWRQRNEGVMLALSRLKYAHSELKAKLKGTGSAYLEETNTWGDTYWGVCDGVGQNKLGKTLMRVRLEP